jgi:PST family polysaccharide transporter
MTGGGGVVATPPPTRDLGGRAVRGAAVTLAGQGVRILVQVLSVVVLSRILSPRDYGLLAMVTAVIGVADIFRDLGLSTAAVQARVLTERQRTNLFWINTALGLLLTTAALFLAPVLAAMYGQPELVEICRILAVTFLLNGVATQYRADLNRSLRFGWLAAADVLAAVMGFGVAVTMARSGAGYWALVGQQVVQYSVMLALVVAGARWWPRLPSRGADMGALLRFGWHMVGTQVIGYVSNNADSVIIGTRLGPGPLGLYNRAFQLLMTPLTQVRAPTTQVALPVLSAVQDDDDVFVVYVKKGQLALGYTLIAGLGIVLGAAPELVAVLLGDQWQAAAPLLGLLALAGALQTLGFVNYWVYLARGLTRELMRYSLIQAAIKITCVAVGSQWGVVGVAAGYALGPALTWPLSFWWLSRSTSLPMRPLVASAARILGLFAAVATATGLAGAVVTGAPEVLALAAAVGGGTVAYVLLCGLVVPLRRDVVAVAAAVRKALVRRGAVAL